MSEDSRSNEERKEKRSRKNADYCISIKDSYIVEQEKNHITVVAKIPSSSFRNFMIIVTFSVGHTTGRATNADHAIVVILVILI